jgi:hypothetical protein
MPEEFDYKRYLASREWAVLREQVRERSGDTCERCRVLPQAAVHHLTYERVGHEDLGDLQATCGPCHAFVSAKSAFDPEHFVRRLPLAGREEAAELITSVLENLPTEITVLFLLHVVGDLQEDVWIYRRQRDQSNQLIEALSAIDRASGV